MEKQPRKRLRKHFYDALLPHEGNSYKPLIFTLGGVGTIIALLLLLQAAYFVQTRIVFTQTDFLASVLPGVLATLTNQDRAKSGVPTLVEDAHLARAAQMKAEDMALKGYFAHVDPEGRQPWYWMDQAGYDYTYAGENLAVNFTDSEDVQKAWMNSPTHHANIVKSQYTRIGIGVAQGTYQGKETTFVVQFFATPRVAAAPAPAPAPTGASTALAVAETPAPEEGEVEEVDSQVLGIEVGTTTPAEPEETPAVETVQKVAPVEEARVDTEQGEGSRVELAAAPALSFFAQVAASPTHTLIYLLAGLAVLCGVLLLIALAAHIKVQYLEVLGGGLIIILVALSLLVFNATNPSAVEIPSEQQPGASTEEF